MKTLSRSIIFAVVVLSCIILGSCSDDDNDNNSNVPSIVGVWVSYSNPYYENGVISPTHDCTGYFWFKENGTFVEADVITNHQTDYTWIELSENGKWSVNGDHVSWTANFEDDDPQNFYTDTYKYKVSGNTLYLTYEDDGKELTGKAQRTTEEAIQDVISEKRRHTSRN